MNGVDVRRINKGPDEGKYRLKIDGQRVKGVYTIEEVMAIIAGKEQTNEASLPTPL